VGISLGSVLGMSNFVNIYVFWLINFRWWAV